MIGIDFLGPFQASSSGERYVIVAVDYATRFVVAKAVRAATGAAAAKFVTQLSEAYSPPAVVITDCGTHFKIGVFRVALDSLHAQQRMSSI